MQYRCNRLTGHATSSAGGRRCLRPEKTEAIVAAFFAELGEKGYAGLTMDRVAERAGVGKAALYRRWPSKQEMLIDLVGQYAIKAVLPPDTGSLRDDLLALANDAIAVLANPLIRSVVQSLVAEARRSPTLRQSLPSASSIRDERPARRCSDGPSSAVKSGRTSTSNSHKTSLAARSTCVA